MSIINPTLKEQIQNQRGGIKKAAGVVAFHRRNLVAIRGQVKESERLLALMKRRLKELVKEANK